jgi:hypothetical protein
MRIKRHDKSDIVELGDGSRWRIWPGDLPQTLQWLPTTEVEIAAIDDEFCSHALLNRSDGSRVRVIEAGATWPVEQGGVRSRADDGNDGASGAIQATIHAESFGRSAVRCALHQA